MIIIDKKRLGIMVGIMLVAVLVFTFKTADINTSLNDKSNLEKTVQTVSLPVSNKVIVLDAGHR